MAQNIAILIGNSEYSKLSNLNCCVADVKRMKELLDATEKFGQIVELVNNSSSEAVDIIREIATEDGEVGEVFFYFSGHGVSNEDDFFMCFRDFSDTNPNTTGISRANLLALLRQFDAALVVAVFDACEAGRNLIKSENGPLNREIKSGISSYIQISSCLDTQYSIADIELSCFTHEFVHACLAKDTGAIYYTDVENALRDAFLNNPVQTPHFIRQGTGQEKFCTDASLLANLRDDLDKVEVGTEVVEAENFPVDAVGVAEAAIKRVEEKIPDSEQAQHFITAVADCALAENKLSEDLARFFELRTVRYDDFDNVENKRSLVRLLDGRKRSDLLVESEAERTKKRNPFVAFQLNILESLGSSEYDTKYNLWNRSNLKSVHVGIYFEPKYMALKRVFSEIVFLPSLTECLVLTSSCFQLRSSWGGFSELNDTKQWKWSKHSWTENPADVAAEYVKDPFEFAMDYILTFSNDD